MDINYKQKKNGMKEKQLLERIYAPLTSIEIDKEDKSFWIELCASSYHTASDLVNENKLIHAIEVDFFGGLRENLESFFEDKEQINCRFQLSFLDVVLLYENMDMFLETLINGRWTKMGRQYLGVLATYIESNRFLYQETLKYLYSEN